MLSLMTLGEESLPLLASGVCWQSLVFLGIARLGGALLQYMSIFSLFVFTSSSPCTCLSLCPNLPLNKDSSHSELDLPKRPYFNLIV